MFALQAPVQRRRLLQNKCPANNHGGIRRACGAHRVTNTPGHSSSLWSTGRKDARACKTGIHRGVGLRVVVRLHALQTCRALAGTGVLEKAHCVAQPVKPRSFKVQERRAVYQVLPKIGLSTKVLRSIGRYLRVAAQIPCDYPHPETNALHNAGPCPQEPARREANRGVAVPRPTGPVGRAVSETFVAG